jgi:hypothetical protein
MDYAKGYIESTTTMIYTSLQQKLANAGLVLSAGLVMFWTLFFTVGLSPENPPPGYEQFEHAFPFPDIMLAAALAISSAGVRRGRSWARSGMTAAGGALIFLGLLDFSFNIQNGMYCISLVETVMNISIQLVCLAMGTLFIRTFSYRS